MSTSKVWDVNSHTARCIRFSQCKLVSDWGLRKRWSVSLMAFTLQFIAACVHGYYGVGCRRQCRCDNNASCDAVTGDCVCPAGRTGRRCERCAYRQLPHYKHNDKRWVDDNSALTLFAWAFSRSTLSQSDSGEELLEFLFSMWRLFYGDSDYFKIT